jgi:hypothetical protein
MVDVVAAILNNNFLLRYRVFTGVKTPPSVFQKSKLLFFIVVQQK